MAILVDAGVVIAAEREAGVRAWLRRLSELPTLSTISVAEVLHGVERAPAGPVRTERERFLDVFLEAWEIVAVDVEIARETARVSADLARRGETVPAFDTVVAATALVRDWPLAAIDRHFERVAGLRLLLPPD